MTAANKVYALLYIQLVMSKQAETGDEETSSLSISQMLPTASNRDLGVFLLAWI